ncbi:MAG: protein kinase [Proteobacteria bacterium]|nr:protein kinase [Pseudomonadota bacterium]
MKTFGRYEIVEKIGQGAMGIVYKGFDPQIKREIALKVLREDQLGNTYFVERFVKEAMAIGRLSHPNIVTVYDVGEDHHTIYIVMELLEGKPLNEIIKDNLLPLPILLDIGIKSAEALDYAHKKGIVHRDVKTTNILISGDNHVKLTDFGIAHFDDPQLAMQTQAGEVLGTPAFMSPEQVLGKPVDGRSDLFSLGVILYEMTTGNKPFSGNHLPAIFEAIIKKEPDYPVHPDRPIPQELSQVILKSLKKNPEERYQSGNEMAQALSRCISRLDAKETRQVIAHPEPAKTVSRKNTHEDEFLSQEKSKMPGGESLFSTGDNPLPTMYYDPRSKTDTPGTKIRTPEKSSIEWKKYWIVFALVFIMAGTGIGYYYFKNQPQVTKEESNTVEKAGPAETSFLTVSTEPEGAFIYMDGDSNGQTPIRIKAEYGSHEIRITLEGYFDQEFQLNVDQPEINLSRRMISIE